MWREKGLAWACSSCLDSLFKLRVVSWPLFNLLIYSHVMQTLWAKPAHLFFSTACKEPISSIYWRPVHEETRLIVVCCMFRTAGAASFIRLSTFYTLAKRTLERRKPPITASRELYGWGFSYYALTFPLASFVVAKLTFLFVMQPLADFFIPKCRASVAVFHHPSTLLEILVDIKKHFFTHGMSHNFVSPFLHSYSSPPL